MALVEPTTKIAEPIPAIVRPGRPAKRVANGHTDGHGSGYGAVVPPKPGELAKGEWSEPALKVLHERYLLKNDGGEVVEDADQMCWRVAWDIACANANFGKNYEEITQIAKDYCQLLISRNFLPNSPTLMNAGKGNGLQYNGCFVIPIEDSMEGIFDGIKWAAIIHKSGGGTGFAFSRLRPSNSRVGSTKGIASGPISFLKVYDAATEQIKQGGSRRGANMGVLRIDHPDVMEFIHCKEDGGITNFNISVGVIEAFMKAYYGGTDYDLVDPKTKRIVAQLSARKVMDEIADGAWKTGDPGMIFIDRVNASSANPVPSLGPIETTNPCGEQPLYPFDACNLGSIFLGNFVRQTDDGAKTVDWEKLRLVTKTAVRFLDDVIERNPLPLPQIKGVVSQIRRIGLGVGGWADMLIDLGIAYDSEEAIALAERTMKFISDAGHEASQDLAVERGPFPLFPESIYKNDQPIRNSTVTTIAPTGTIGIIAGASTGIEPLFAIAFKHYVKTNALEREMSFFNPLFEKMATGQAWYTDSVKEKIADGGTITHLEEIPAEVRKIFRTAHDIEPGWHVRTQAAFQKYTDNAVSKTINLPNSATREDIKKAYLQAYESGCLGITVYRDGSKSIQVLNLGTQDKQSLRSSPEAAGLRKQEDKKIEEPAAVLQPRPVRVDGATYRIETPLGTAFITVNQDNEGNPFEVFVSVGKAGSEVAAMAEAIGRLISTTLRFGNHLPARERAMEIIDQLQGIGGPSAVGFGPNRIRSLPDAVAKAISLHFGLSGQGNGVSIKGHGENVEGQASLSQISHRDLCPSCGEAAFVFEEGCAKCYSCGYSKC